MTGFCSRCHRQERTRTWSLPIEVGDDYNPITSAAFDLCVHCYRALSAYMVTPEMKSRWKP